MNYPVRKFNCTKSKFSLDRFPKELGITLHKYFFLGLKNITYTYSVMINYPVNELLKSVNWFKDAISPMLEWMVLK